MSRIVIFGGHGRVALLLEPLLVSGGHAVTAVIRNPEHGAEVGATGATFVVADVEESGLDRFTDLITGHDAVVWSAGAGGGDPKRTYAIDRDAAIRTMDAAAAAGVRRYVMISWIGSVPDHGVDPESSFFPYADAKLAADEYLRAGDLDWTILCPGMLTFDPPVGRIALDVPGRAEVSRADVAAVIAAVLADDSTIGRTIRFGAGDVEIAEALSIGRRAGD
ncbi:SDR family oxidoreductase [Microbacterium deminutum]|uniref:SDR family oxidoreductase n=1 Tax=Microbacterium deminutum TaxID=344164 RepID=A0ABN2QCD8_9MICO